MNSKNTKDVMVTFLPAMLKRIDEHCKRTGLKRSTAVMQALHFYLVDGGRHTAIDLDLQPQPAASKTESLVKTKLRRR